MVSETSNIDACAPTEACSMSTMRRIACSRSFSDSPRNSAAVSTPASPCNKARWGSRWTRFDVQHAAVARFHQYWYA